jgi:hypothetical protein
MAGYKDPRRNFDEEAATGNWRKKFKTLEIDFDK